MPAAPEDAFGSAPDRLAPIPPRGLPKSYRLLRGNEFQAVLRQRCSLRDALFAVYATPNDLGHARLGVAVSRKVSTRAVSRNRIKRQVREMFRQQQQLLSGLDVVVVAQPQAAARENPELRAALERHWQGITRKCKK